MTDAAGSAVTPSACALESYLSRWETGNAKISARYRQLLDAVLGPGGNTELARLRDLERPSSARMTPMNREPRGLGKSCGRREP
jgi:hypothetical protein